MESQDESTDSTYGGTRGYSGSTSSMDAAHADLVTGVTNKTQRLVLILAAQAGERGVTIAELREAKGGLHHGRMSSALTKQHIAGRLVALTERRGHCGVYVLPEHVNGREVRPYRGNRRPLNADEVYEILFAHRATPNGCGCGAPLLGASHRHHVAREIARVIEGKDRRAG